MGKDTGLLDQFFFCMLDEACRTKYEALRMQLMMGALAVVVIPHLPPHVDSDLGSNCDSDCGADLHI